MRRQVVLVSLRMNPWLGAGNGLLLGGQAPSRPSSGVVPFLDPT